MRRFENVNWLMNKDKIGFLGESLKDMLRETFKLVEEFNQQIKAAKKPSLIVTRPSTLPDSKNYWINAVRNWKIGWFRKPGRKNYPRNIPH